MAPEDSNNIGMFQVQVIGLCKQLSGASLILVLWRYNWSYIKNRTLRATVLCWCPLTYQLFQDHKTTNFCQVQHCHNDPKSVIYCMQGCKTNPSSSFQWIHGVEYIGRWIWQEQSSQFPLRRLSVPTGIASWLPWRCTRNLQLLRLISHRINDLCCSNQVIDNISFQGQNPSMLDRGLLDFWSMIDTL